MKVISFHQDFIKRDTFFFQEKGISIHVNQNFVLKTSKQGAPQNFGTKFKWNLSLLAFFPGLLPFKLSKFIMENITLHVIFSINYEYKK